MKQTLNGSRGQLCRQKLQRQNLQRVYLYVNKNSQLFLCNEYSVGFSHYIAINSNLANDVMYFESSK